MHCLLTRENLRVLGAQCSNGTSMRRVRDLLEVSDLALNVGYNGAVE